MDNELVYALAISYVKGIGDILSKRIIEEMGSAEAAWRASKIDLEKIERLTSKSSVEIGATYILDKARREIEWTNKNNIKIFYFFSEDYPQRLKQCIDAPLLLFTKGNIDFEKGHFVSIVGTRRMTRYGKQFIQDLIPALKNYPLTIVSGLAFGCDITAHQMAIAHQLPSISVLAHGLNQIYPKEHKKEVEEMCHNGGIVSEFSSFHNPIPENFLRRNRIIAGLSDITIVIESEIKGGAISTARLANNYNRDVFALPGRVNDKLSLGCNYLINNHQAYLIQGEKDVIAALNLDIKPPRKKQTQLFITLDEEEKPIYELLFEKGSLHIDDLAYQLGIPGYKLMNVLLQMELKNIIKSIPGKQFQLL